MGSGGEEKVKLLPGLGLNDCFCSSQEKILTSYDPVVVLLT